LNWDAISAIGQLIGALGVIVSIGYLAVQIRQNTRAVRGASAFEAFSSYADINRWIAETPALHPIILTSWQPNARLPDLTAEERVRFETMGRNLVLRFQAHFFQYKHGIIDESTWEMWRTWLHGQLTVPFWADWWTTERTQIYYHPEFLASVETAPSLRIHMVGVDPLGAAGGPR
jgi:hypothetical protein